VLRTRWMCSPGRPRRALSGPCRAWRCSLDANIPTNLGTGTNEDRIIVARFDDDLLFESGAPTVGVYDGGAVGKPLGADHGVGILRLHLRPLPEGELDHRRHRIDCTDLLGGGRDSGWVGCRKVPHPATRVGRAPYPSGAQGVGPPGRVVRLRGWPRDRLLRLLQVRFSSEPA